MIYNLAESQLKANKHLLKHFLAYYHLMSTSSWSHLTEHKSWSSNFVLWIGKKTATEPSFVNTVIQPFTINVTCSYNKQTTQKQLKFFEKSTRVSTYLRKTSRNAWEYSFIFVDMQINPERICWKRKKNKIIGHRSTIRYFPFRVLFLRLHLEN